MTDIFYGIFYTLLDLFRSYDNNSTSYGRFYDHKTHARRETEAGTRLGGNDHT